MKFLRFCGTLLICILITIIIMMISYSAGYYMTLIVIHNTLAAYVIGGVMASISAIGIFIYILENQGVN